MPAKPKKRKLVIRAILILIALVALLSSIAPYVSPLTFWPVAILGLGFYYFYILNLSMLILLLFFRRKFFFVCLIPFLCGLPVILNFLAFNFNDAETTSDDKQSFKILTYNVRIFDLYSWSRNLESRLKYFDFFEKENPDVMCLQEFYTSSNAEHRNMETLRQRRGAVNVHSLLPIFIYGTDRFGIATLTRFPIIHRETIFADSSSANGGIATDVLIGNDTVRIYNLHLQSIRFKKEDYGFVKNISSFNKQSWFSGAFGIIGRLKKAFIKRTKQAQLVADNIKKCPHRFVVCGDFNDTPASYTYHLISKNMEDAFLKNGLGAGKTYNGIFPAFRIDYILCSPQLKTASYTKHPFNLSDHFPVSAKVILRHP